MRQTIARSQFAALTRRRMSAGQAPGSASLNLAAAMSRSMAAGSQHPGFEGGNQGVPPASAAVLAPSCGYRRDSAVNPVAALLLGAVERCVGGFDQALVPAAIDRHRCRNADADRDERER